MGIGYFTAVHQSHCTNEMKVTQLLKHLGLRPFVIGCIAAVLWPSLYGGQPVVPDTVRQAADYAAAGQWTALTALDAADTSADPRTEALKGLLREHRHLPTAVSSSVRRCLTQNPSRWTASPRIRSTHNRPCLQRCRCSRRLGTMRLRRSATVCWPGRFSGCCVKLRMNASAPMIRPGDGIRPGPGGCSGWSSFPPNRSKKPPTICVLPPHRQRPPSKPLRYHRRSLFTGHAPNRRTGIYRAGIAIRRAAAV